MGSAAHLYSAYCNGKGHAKSTPRGKLRPVHHASSRDCRSLAFPRFLGAATATSPHVGRS
jgi:hypothetical protein